MTKTQAKPELDYRAFLNRKSQLGGMSGFEPLWMPDRIKPFQRYLAEWDIRKGRGGCFAGTGLGKTIVQLTCAENVVRKTNRNVLVLTPLAVGPQTVREGEKFGIEAKHSRDGKIHGKITVTNYEQIHKFDPLDFAAVHVQGPVPIRIHGNSSAKRFYRTRNNRGTSGGNASV